jgi:hypothetical protein
MTTAWLVRATIEQSRRHYLSLRQPTPESFIELDGGPTAHRQSDWTT